jgi:ubiquinone/menaquinone biosynthesis C-methylase UbiE
MKTIDFDRWARTYDGTRGASPSVLRPLLEALGAPDGRKLIDLGGGTGNFAAPLVAAGFAVTVSDLSPAMAERARAKIAGSAVAADAQALPFRDAAFDCAVCQRAAAYSRPIAGDARSAADHA